MTFQKFVLFMFTSYLITIAMFVHAEVKQEKLEAGMTNPGNIEKPSWFKESFLDIREDIEEASSDNKNIILYFYQDGCPYCKKLLQDNFGNHDISSYTQKHYEVIAINMWGDREVTSFNGEALTEKTFSEKYKIMFTPSMLILDQRGEKAMRINGYYHPNKFKSALKYVKEIVNPSRLLKNKLELKNKVLSFREYYAQSPQTKALGIIHHDPSFLKAPYNLAKNRNESKKPLLVLFEQKKCLICDELHQDILKRTHQVKLLHKFDVVVLDMWSTDKLITPNGEKIAIKKWAAKLNIQSGPSFVFFDQTSQEVFRTDGYIKAFHVGGVMDYVLSKSYIKQPNFQRWLGAKTDALENQGIHVDLWK